MHDALALSICFLLRLQINGGAGKMEDSLFYSIKVDKSSTLWCCCSFNCSCACSKCGRCCCCCCCWCSGGVGGSFPDKNKRLFDFYLSSIFFDSFHKAKVLLVIKVPGFTILVHSLEQKTSQPARKSRGSLESMNRIFPFYSDKCQVLLLQTGGFSPKIHPWWIIKRAKSEQISPFQTDPRNRNN